MSLRTDIISRGTTDLKLAEESAKMYRRNPEVTVQIFQAVMTQGYQPPGGSRRSPVIITDLCVREIVSPRENGCLGSWSEWHYTLLKLGMQVPSRG